MPGLNGARNEEPTVKEGWLWKLGNWPTALTVVHRRVCLTVSTDKEGNITSIILRDAQSRNLCYVVSLTEAYTIPLQPGQPHMLVPGTQRSPMDTSTRADMLSLLGDLEATADPMDQVKLEFWNRVLSFAAKIP